MNHDTSARPTNTHGTDPCEAGFYEKRGRFWAVTDAAGRLVCLAVYKKGAQEVLRRLAVTEEDKDQTTVTTET